MMSAACAAALAGVYVTAEAQGVDVLVEIEGPLSAYTATTTTSGALTVMNAPVLVTETTEFVSPTGDRSTTASPNNPNRTMTVTQWMRGATFDGRRRPGLLGGTVIVTGLYNTASGAITASEVFSDVAENVMLGVVTDSSCSAPNCDGPGDYIRGNNGPVFIPNKDPRLTAGPLTDAGLFALDMTTKSFGGTIDVPVTFAGEGFFSDDKIFPEPGAPNAEQAIVYWAFELGENRPDLVATPGVAEISALRIRCTEGGRLEVRGFVHAPMDETGAPTGIIGQPLSGGEGRIRATMTVNGVTTTYFDQNNDPPTADLPGTYGVYRLRQDVTSCGTSGNVYWEPANGGAPWAEVLDVPVDRVRLAAGG
ncbi:MAG: hypothetical protein FP825_05715 [Hyphomonas sp.]|nr:hypothetical protein [Hyphomonas sp.]MBU4061302.1 hypothetical protein [Alphaproteobacteria bacterium]MBU4162555.1 hypothetical protein [Alphaproteobacteria bacterium]